MTSRILVCGGRDYTDRYTFFRIMDEFRKTTFFSRFCIIQGGARGADRLAKEWAFSIPVPCLQFDAPWDTIGDSAGTMRNRWMLDYGYPDLVIAFPGNRGTNHMCSIARDAGIRVETILGSTNHKEN
jgi:YspA, cpYpsA-related SLOG family